MSTLSFTFLGLFLVAHPKYSKQSYIDASTPQRQKLPLLESPRLLTQTPSKISRYTCTSCCTRGSNVALLLTLTISVAKQSQNASNVLVVYESNVIKSFQSLPASNQITPHDPISNTLLRVAPHHGASLHTKDSLQQSSKIFYQN